MLQDKPIFTQTIDLNEIDSFDINPVSAYIYCSSVEERTNHIIKWKKNYKDINFFRIKQQEIDGFTVHVNKKDSFINLSSPLECENFWNQIQNNIIYIDITGIDHHIFASLVKYGISSGKNIHVIYAEAQIYKSNNIEFEFETLNPNAEIHSIKQIPGFVRFYEYKDSETVFLPLLGFQGNRFSYMLEKLENSKVFPFLGLPSLRPEYYDYAHWANRKGLTQLRCKGNIVQAPVNCPFSVFYEIEEIYKRERPKLIKVGLLGTKPHCLGGLLFFLKYESDSNIHTEIVYDYPKQKITKVKGISRLNIYYISEFLSP
jgi:hypothetical protein